MKYLTIFSSYDTFLYKNRFASEIFSIIFLFEIKTFEKGKFFFKQLANNDEIQYLIGLDSIILFLKIYKHFFICPKIISMIF